MATEESSTQTSVRARPLSVEDRRAAIIEAVLPLLVAHGKDVTSKQIAEAAGIAEGTVFRAFGDKDSLIYAAIETILDPEPLRRGLRAIPVELPLEEKVHSIIVLLQNWFSDIFRVMASMGISRPPKHKHKDGFSGVIAEILSPELSQLNLPPARGAQVIRLLTFAACVPHLNEDATLTSKELSAIILYGIAGTPGSSTTNPNED